MAFTYSGNPSSSTLDQVRFLVGDTDSTNAHFQDAEIQWLLVQWADPYEAAAVCADALVGRYAQMADTVKKVGDLQLNATYARASDGFKDLAKRLRDQRMRLATPIPVVNPAALQSTEDRVVDVHNTDSYLGIHDFTR